MADGGAAAMDVAPNGSATISVTSRGSAGTSATQESAAGSSAGPPATLPQAAFDCPTDRTVLEQAAPATYSIVFEASTAQGVQPLFVATAFAVGPNLLATNSHVTEGLKEYVGQLDYTDVVAVQSGTGAVVRLDGAVSHPGFTGNPLSEPDVGLLTTSSTLPNVLALAPADGTTTVHVTDEVYVIGFPGDVDAVVPTIPGETVPQATALQGNVTALRNFGPTVRVTETTTDVIQHDAATSPGMSGSPLLFCGRVVGVNNAGTIQRVLVPGENGELSVEHVGVAANNFGIDVKHLHDLVLQFQRGAVAAFDLNAHSSIPPSSTPPPPGTPSGGVPAVAPPLVPDDPVAPRPATRDANWVVFNDPATGQLCEILNGADFEAVVLAGTLEVMLVNVYDESGQGLGTDTTVAGLTLGPDGKLLSEGVATGGVVQFAVDADGLERLFAFKPDGTLWASSVRADLVGLTPDRFSNVRCDACGAVDDPAPGRCE